MRNPDASEFFINLKGNESLKQLITYVDKAESGYYKGMDGGTMILHFILSQNLDYIKFTKFVKKLGKDRIELYTKYKSIIDSEHTVLKKKYHEHYQSALEKFGVNSASKLKGEKRKEFFDYVDNFYDSDSSCFVATATLNDPNNPIVVDLRKYRDKQLLNNHFGRTFVKVYYYTGPTLAKMISNSRILKYVSLHFIIKPLHFLIKMKNFN